MLTLINAQSVLNQVHRSKSKPAKKEDLAKLDLLREEIGIPWVELNRLACVVVGRNVNDCRELSTRENRVLREYMQCRFGELWKKYRRLQWK